MGLSSFTVHHLIKIFGEFREMSVPKGQSQNTILNGSDLYTLHKTDRVYEHCGYHRQLTQVVAASTVASENFHPKKKHTSERQGWLPRIQVNISTHFKS